MSRTRNFCFTLNNYSDEDLEFLNSAVTNEALNLNYLCFGKEVGESLTPHLQGYIQCNQASSIKALQKRFQTQGGKLGHVECARGSLKSNQEYTSKEGVWVEFGTARATGQGSRSDIHTACAKFNDPEFTMDELANEHPEMIVKYANGFSKLAAMRMPKRDFQTELYWYWGPTGTGKSRKAWEEFPDAYSKDPSTKWWDNYWGQSTVILDDFRPNKEIPFSQLLRLADRYPLSVEFKGGYMNFCSKTIVITTPYSPEETCEKMDWLGQEQINQLLRRITKRIKFGDQVEVNRLFN